MRARMIEARVSFPKYLKMFPITFGDFKCNTDLGFLQTKQAF